MSKALQLLTDHFERQRGRAIPVPEIIDPETGQPLVVYADPITTELAQKISHEAKGRDKDLPMWTVIYAAKDKDGNRLFDDSVETRAALKKQVDGQILGKLAADIMGGDSDLGNSSTPATTPD